MARRESPRIPDALLDELLGGTDPKTALDPNGFLDDLKRALAEPALNAEMEPHLGDRADGNVRNGYGRKAVLTDNGKMELDVPRDRQGSFDPQLIAKYQRRFPDRASLLVAPGLIGAEGAINLQGGTDLADRHLPGHTNLIDKLTARAGLRASLRERPEASPCPETDPPQDT